METAKWGQVEMALRSGHGNAGPSNLASLGNVVSQLTDAPRPTRFRLVPRPDGRIAI